MNEERAALRGRIVMAEREMRVLKTEAEGQRVLLHLAIPSYENLENLRRDKIEAASKKLCELLGKIKEVKERLIVMEEELNG